MSKKKYYVTTPIYYVNAEPHVGHFYTSVAADVLARYRRLRGEEVFFLTGTDENSQKNVEAAAKQGYGDDIQGYLDMMATRWRDTFASLGITFDDYIRTTEPRHKKAVEKFWRKVMESGDIYQGDYEGLYCVGCEAFVRDSDLVDGKCPIHKTEPATLKERNWFFRLSAYRERLLAHIDAHPEFIMPEGRRNEIRSYIDRFMEDVSISRETVKWGIAVPDDPKSVIYVWFDALINYLTGIGYGTDDEKFASFWPADLHLVGKDIIKFHCALWPAMLMAAGLPLPTRVFANGYFTIDGEKISKSLGNAIDPHKAAAEYGMDPLRYYLLREIPFGGDGDFSMTRLGERYSGDLANEYGNLVFRVLSMTERYLGGKIPAAGEGSTEEAWKKYETAMEEVDFGGALDAAWGILRESNKLIDTEKPWELAKTDMPKLELVLGGLLEKLRHAGWMLLPFMPEKARETLVQIGAALPEETTYDAAKGWGGMPENGMIRKGEPLFPRKAA